MVATDFYAKINDLLLNVDEKTVLHIKNEILRSDRIFLVGNGGSMAIAEHICNDLVKRCNIQALTLSNNSLFTCLANDFQYNNALSEWLKRMKISDVDTLIAISSSGRSKNIVNAIQEANEAGANTIGLAGFSNFHSSVLSLLDTSMHFNSSNYGEVEMATEIVLHGIIEDIVENNLETDI